MPSSRVSIAIPTYEPQAAHLRTAIESVLTQTMQDWDLLIHDDASRVDVREIIEPYLADPRIRFERSASRLGIGGNWNACIPSLKATYVQYLFQDDTWHPAYLQTMIDSLEKNPAAGFAAANHRYSLEGPIDTRAKEIYQSLDTIRARELIPGFHRSDEFLRAWITRGLRPNIIGEPSFVMLKRELLEIVGPFREDLPQALDSEYWLRCLLQTNWVFIPDILGDFRVHASGASAQNDRQGRGLFDRLSLFETLLQCSSKDMRSQAGAALSKEFSRMMKAFFSRVEEKKGISSGGSGKLVRLMMRHPVLVMRGIFGKMPKAKN